MIAARKSECMTVTMHDATIQSTTSDVRPEQKHLASIAAQMALAECQVNRLEDSFLTTRRVMAKVCPTVKSDVTITTSVVLIDNTKFARSSPSPIRESAELSRFMEVLRFTYKKVLVTGEVIFVLKTEPDELEEA